MSRYLRILLAIGLLVALLPVSAASAQGIQPVAVQQSQLCQIFWPSGVEGVPPQYMFCVPPGWNGDLIVFAHGYVDVYQPVTIPLDQLTLPGETISLPEIAMGMGMAFATTSYPANGLVVLPGVQDIRALVAFFRTYLLPMIPGASLNHVYLVGASEGGLVTTLAIERYPAEFSGGLALCGPIGDFRKQVDYWGDFRVLYDYFFSATFARYGGSPIDISEKLIADWKAGRVQPLILALLQNPNKAAQLLKVSGVPIDPALPASVGESVLGVLGYNVLSTNNGIQVLGGNPFDNSDRQYSGSSNDWLLNSKVFRAQASPTALDNLSNYQTSGILAKPLVTMHTTGDPIVPFWHEELYAQKVLASGSEDQYLSIPIVRYGHCTFTEEEALYGFWQLVTKAGGTLPSLSQIQAILPEAGMQSRFLELVENPPVN